MMEWYQTLWLFFPIIAVLMPLFFATHKFVVQPLIEAITRVAESRGANADLANHPRLRELEQGVAALEQSVKNILDEQAFQHELLRSLAAGNTEESADAGNRVQDAT